jgi:RNA polymerase sigma-70 factor (ECF subfamily)
MATARENLPDSIVRLSIFANVLYLFTDSGARCRPCSFSKESDANLTDAALATAAVEGDPGAHAAIWDRYSPLIRRLLLRGIGSADVEDLVQEVFLRFHTHRKLLRDPEALRSFLCGIAVRVAGAELRARRVRSWLRLTRDGVLHDFEAPTADQNARRAVRRLYAILDGLNPKSRLAFVLHFIEGWELVDVAATFEVSLATIKRRLSRAYLHVFARAQADDLLVGYLVDATRAVDKEER